MSKERYECEHNWIIDNNKRNTNESLIVYDEDCNTLDDICELFNKQDQKIADLEAKLAEKEKEIEEIKQIISKYTDKLPDNVVFDIANDDIRYQIVSNLIDKNTNYRNQIKELRQDKTDFAIEQLEKVKTQCEFSITFASDEQEQRLYDFIDNLIKELKEGQ